jgi:hypothetical protein
MNRKAKLLPGKGKYLSGGVLYNAGDVLPDEEAEKLVKSGRAAWVEEAGEEEKIPEKPEKPVRKPMPPKKTDEPETPEEAEK